jgi:transposase InsO family protein
MTQNVKKGLEFLRNGMLCYSGYIRQTHGTIEIHSADGNLELISPENFRREIVDGVIEFLAAGDNGMLHPVSTNWMDTERDCAKKERHLRTQIVTFVDGEFKRGVRLNVIFRGLETYCESMGLGKAPCERTLRSWRKFAKGHQSMMSPSWNRCGNRKQGPDEILLSCMSEVVNIAILGSDRFTLSAAWQVIEALYDTKWREANGTAPHPRNSIRKLKTFLRAMSWSETVKLQLDGRTARALTRSAVQRNTADVLWEVVEMDATVLDILVRDEQGHEIGRPVLYVAIDVATGYIVGLYLTIQKPSSLPFVECLRFMLFPKPDGFDAKYGILNRVEVFGKPALLRVDNGSEFIGIIATEYVRQLFGDTARCQPYKPEEKPHVERFNGTLKTYILTLAGATTSSVTGAKRTPPKSEKLYTIEELRKKIFQFVYDRYSLQSNALRSKRSGKAVAPVDIVRHMKMTFTEPVPVNRQEFERSLCFRRANRALGHDGITFDGWKYHSEKLKSMYANGGSVNVEFMYSDLDVTTIYVKPPSGELIAAFEKDWEGTSVDRELAKSIKAAIQAEGKELNRRTYAHKIAEFRALEKTVKSSRSRAKTARANDMVKAAEEHQRLTMPNKPSEPPIPYPRTPTPGSSDFMKDIPRGRKVGERK